MALRDGPFSEVKVPLTLAAGGAVAAAAALAIFFLVSDRRENVEAAVYTRAQQAADSVQAPVGAVLSAPVRWTEAGIDGVRSFFGAIGENPRLRREVKEIPILKAQLAAERDKNERLMAILGLRTDPPMPMISGRAVTDARGPFAHARLINAGAERGVKVGYPVLSEYGLVGRVVGVQDGISRVLLLTDVASRTPVMIDRTNARAILTGDGGVYPKLDNMRSRQQPKVGDVLVTSGDGGVFPRGLPVGVVVKGLDGAWRAQLASDRAPIDYVRVLRFEDFTQLADEQRLAASIMPAQMGGAIPAPQPPAPTVKLVPKVEASPAPAGALPKAATPAPGPQPKAAPATQPKAAAASQPKAAAPAAPQPKAPAQKAATPAEPKAATVTSSSPKGPPSPVRPPPEKADQ